MKSLKFTQKEANEILKARKTNLCNLTVDCLSMSIGCGYNRFVIRHKKGALIYKFNENSGKFGKMEIVGIITGDCNELDNVMVFTFRSENGVHNFRMNQSVKYYLKFIF
jgi:hypothetical protein